jgi:hypothetical protein
MEELKALQQKLVDIQKTAGGFKLSERTVVDIIQKVINRGKIKLIHTTTGREYVAEEKVTKEILDELKRNQGRISKLELTKILEVPINVIDSKINALISKDKSLNLIEGKLITNYYLENMCNEINELLKVNGCLFISDLATKFDLSMDYFKKYVKFRVGTSIKAKLYETRLLTDEYVESQKVRIRPALIGTITPLNISYLVDNYHIDELIVEDLVKGLISSGIISGKLVANVYEPAIYSISQASYVKGVLMQNNFIEYTKLKNIGITKNAKEYIKDLNKKDNTFTDGIYLKEYFISSGMKNNFEYIFFDNLSKNCATNLNSVFLFELQEEDVNTLLESINVKPSSVMLINMNLIPTSFVEAYMNNVTSKLKEEASKQYNNIIAAQKEKKTEKEPQNSKKGKGKSTKGGAKKGKAEEEDEDDNSQVQMTPVFKKDLEQILFKSPNVEDMNDTKDTLQELFNKTILPKITVLYTQFINEFVKSKSQSSNDPKSIVAGVENEYLDLKFMQKSMEILTKQNNEASFQTALKAITAHICKKDLTNILKNIITYQLIHMKSKVDLNRINDPNQRKDVIHTFADDDIKEIFVALNDNITNKNFLSFMTKLDESTKILAISLPFWDKKKEKLLIEKYIKEWTILIEDKFALLGKTNKKDYISAITDICHMILIKKNIFIKLPYEIWAVSIFTNLIPEQKNILTALNEIVNLSEDTFYLRQEEALDYVKKLYNSI